MYSWTVAQCQVRDCYAGNFPGDLFMPEQLPLSQKIFSIKDIKNAVGNFDEKSIEIFSNQTKITDEKVLAHRATIQRNYQNALISPGTLYKCSEEDGLEILKKCYSSADPLCGSSYHDCYPCKYEGFCIFKLYNRVCREDIRLLQLCKYPAEGPGSKELRESIERNRADLQKEIPDHEYSRE